MAFAQARKGEQGRAIVRLGGVEHQASLAPLGAGQVLVRLDQAAREPLRPDLCAGSDADRFGDPGEGSTPSPPASPFGAALLDGGEVFSARILESNRRSAK
jgi:two-component system cell cycle sensor histidine kinase/response regulator CckA